MYVIMKTEEQGGSRILCEKDFRYWSGTLFFTTSVDSPKIFPSKFLAHTHKLKLGLLSVGSESYFVKNIDIQDCGHWLVGFRKGYDYEWLRRKGTGKIVKVWSKKSHRKTSNSSWYCHETEEVTIKDVGVFSWSDFERIDWEEVQP